MNRSFWAGLLQFSPLWIAVLARSIAQAAVAGYAYVVLFQGAFAGNQVALLFFWLCISALPSFALAPLIGALASSQFRRATMIASAGLALAGISSCALLGDSAPWAGCVGLLAIEGAFFTAGWLTFAPIIARQTKLTLPGVNGLLTLACAFGGLVGLALGLVPFMSNTNAPGPTFPIRVGLGGYAVAALALLFVRFRFDESVSISSGLMRPFIEAFRDIIHTRNARNTFLMLLGWHGAVLLYYFEWSLTDSAPFAGALAAGLALGGLHFHPFRSLGQVPFVLLGLVGCAAYNALSGDWQSPVWASGILLGAMVAPLLTAFQASLSPRSWGHASAILLAGLAIVSVIFAGYLQGFRDNPGALPAGFHWPRLILILFLAVYSWVVFLRPALELVVEIVIWPIHRVRAVGTGFDEIPWSGPCLIIANHGAMLDPLWIAKYVPRPTTPMMISTFYDLPVISWLMRRVLGTIRVPDSALRREAPEVQEAIAALDRGACVVIFPEGWLRRKEEMPLRRFARGAWQILKARPQTPVYAFWIEGNWGSFFSWKGGRLMKGKPMDFWRPITIAGTGRHQIEPRTLENHLATRGQLMQWVLEARALLGLPPIDTVHFRGDGDDEKAEGHS